MDNLNQITDKFAKAYDQQKSSELDTKYWRAKFFKAASEGIEERETLARQVIEAPLGNGVDEYIKRFHPGWRYANETDDGKVIIEEDPAFKKFVWINTERGLIFRRDIAQKSPELDDERLQEEDPELWERITEPTRVLRAQDEWSVEDLPLIQKYFVPGKLETRMAAPRAPKEGEL